MVYKPTLMKSRGSAGESAMSPRRGYNFANMYALNKTDEARNEVAGLGDKLKDTQNKTDDLARSGQEAARRGQDPAQYTNQMAQQVDKAQGLSQVANSYNVGANAMKGGQSAYQGGITSFYAGGTGAQNQARKFGGIYDQVRNTAGIYNSGIGAIYGQGKQDVLNKDKMTPEEIAAQNAAHERAMGTKQDTIDAGNWNRQNTPGRDEMNQLSDIDWMLKTGRITAEQRALALKDKAYYDKLMKQFS